MTLHSVCDDDDDDDDDNGDNTSTSNVMIRDSINETGSCTNGFGILDGAMYWMDMLLDLFVTVRRTCSVYCKTIGLFFVLV